ncbi:MAG: response regulator [Opitutaceae bacterium]
MAGRILVLDDEENYAEMLQELLRENNYRVDMATRPERAIDQLEEIPYDLVISDYKMPVMDGADFLKRARELYPNLPFILVSGLMNTPELVKVANMSVTLVMEKPLDTAAFLKHVARFSVPLTEDEKEALSQQSSDDNVADASVHLSSYPEEPRYFSAGSASSKRFMQKVWAACENGTHCYMLEVAGGEAELAAKDISVWRGNHDRPVGSIAFSELVDGGFDKVRSLAEHTENSHVVVVRLPDISSVAEAQSYLSKLSSDKTDLLLVFVIAQDDAEKAFLEAVGDSLGFVLPALSERPSDVANYIRRFSRLAAERMNKPSASEISAEGTYALLAHDWKSCQQLQEVVTQLVTDCPENESLSGDLICSALGVDPKKMSSPDRRLVSLMRRAQMQYLGGVLADTEQTAAELARSLELDTSVQTMDDLLNMPLIKAELAKF